MTTTNETFGRVKGAPNYKVRQQNVREWRKEHRRTPEQIAASNKAWAKRQAERRAVEAEERRTAETYRAASKTAMGQAFIKAGFFGR